MKRRFFIAGLMAAPVVAAGAPALAKPEPEYAMKRVVGSVTVTRSGFTAEELQNIGDAMRRHYLEQHSKRVGYALFERRA